MPVKVSNTISYHMYFIRSVLQNYMKTLTFLNCNFESARNLYLSPNHVGANLITILATPFTDKSLRFIDQVSIEMGEAGDIGSERLCVNVSDFYFRTKMG